MKFEEFQEGKYRENDVEEFVPSDEQLDEIKNKFLPDWEMLDHRELTTMYVCQDHRQAEEMTGFINDLSEKMDHFAEVTQDVTEVKVKTSTFDVKGLTVLDFQLAMSVDAWAEKKGIKQASTSGNFGMHEAHPNDKIYDKCWKGYKKVPGKKRGEPGSCVKEENLDNCKHGKYYCSTDKKWKCRKAPKQSRS